MTFDNDVLEYFKQTVEAANEAASNATPDADAALSYMRDMMGAASPEEEAPSAPKPGEYGAIRANGVQMKPEDFSGMGERGGVESALLNIQRDTGIESDYDGTWGGGLKNALYATGHAGAGRAFAGAMNKNLQFLAKGTDADGVPLEQLPDNEVDYLMDSAGANGAGGWFRRFLGAGASGAWRGEDNIMRQWDETDGARIEDPAERKRARVAYAREIARGMIGQTETSKQRAAAELEGREETTAGAALRGLIEQGGYTLPFIAGSMLGGTPGSFLLAGGLEGADRYNELRGDRLAMDVDGNIGVEAAGDEVSDAAGKALLRGIMSPTIEMVGGKAASALGGKLLGATIGKVPLFRKAGNALAATKAGRAVDAFAKRLNFLGRYTGMQGMPEEMAEELEDQVLDAAFGIDRRESEKREGETWTDRAGESFSDFFKGENLKELATSMLLMQVIGGGVGGYAMDRIRSRHIDGVLREVAGVDASELKYYTADEKMDAFKAWADGLTEDEIADKFNKGAKQVNRMVSEIRRNVGENQFAETDADAPKFNAPMRTNGDGQTLADENGNPIPDFQEVTDDAGRPVMRLYDAESGVTIDRIDMGDGDSQFRVTDAAGRVRAAETYQQAVERANQMLSGEYLSGAKRQYLESLTRPGRMLSGMDIVAGDSLRDVVDEIGERYGEEAAESVRRRIGNPDEDTSGQSFRYVLPDGRSGVAFVLGKIGSVEEMATAAMHEAGRHAGLDMLFDTPQKKADFLKKIDGKGIDTGAAARAMTPEQRRSFEGELADIQQRYGLASRDDVFKTPEAVEELFAYFTENEFGNASLKNRFVAGLRSLYRDMFDADLSYNDADLLAMAGELNRRMRGNTEAGRMTYRSAQTRLGREEAGDIENRRQGRRALREQERQRANAPAQIPYNPTAPEGTTVPRLGYDPAQTSYGPIVTPQTQAESWKYDERPGQAWGDIVRNGPNLLQQMRNGQRGRQAAENGPRSAGTETGATAPQNGAEGVDGGKTVENGGKPQDLSDLIQETEEFPLNPKNSSNREFPVGTIVKRSDGSTYIRVDGELEDIASGEKEPKWQEHGVVGRPGRYAVQSHVIGGTSTPERGGAKIITTPPRKEATPPNGAEAPQGGISRQNGAQATNGRVNSEQMRRIKSKNRILTDKEVESSTGKEPDVMDEKAWDAWYEKAVVVKDRHVAEHDMGNWNTVEVSRAGRDKDGNPTYEAYVVNGVESPVYTMGGVEGDKMPFFVNWLGVDPNDTRIESLATEFMAKRGRPNGMTSLDNRKGRQPRNRKDGHAWDIDEAGPQFENFKDAHDFGNLPEVKRIIEEFGNESESERKNTNETGNGTAEAPAQPEQGAAGTAGTETAGQVAGTAQGAEAQTAGVVRPRTRRGQNLRGYSYEDYAAHPDDGGTGDEIGASILRFARDNGGLLRMPPKGAADPFSDWIAGFLDGNAKKNRRGDYIALFGMRPRTGTNDALTENMPSDLQAYVENMIEREGPEAVVNWFLETRRNYAEWAANKRNAAREEKAVSRERDEEAAAYTDEELARRASERDAASEAEAEEDAAIERQEEEWDRAEREAIEAEAREADERARREQSAREGGSASAAPSAENRAPRRLYTKDGVTFKNPIVGKTGAKVTGYVWPNKGLEYIDKNGNDRVKRISDWDFGETSEDTGRQIIHQFTVEMPDGSLRTVSAESAAKLLGISVGEVKGDALKQIRYATAIASMPEAQKAAFERKSNAGGFLKPDDSVTLMKDGNLRILGWRGKEDGVTDRWHWQVTTITPDGKIKTNRLATEPKTKGFKLDGADILAQSEAQSEARKPADFSLEAATPEQLAAGNAAPNARERLASVYAEWADGEALPAWADRLTDAEAKEYADLIDAALNVDGDDGGAAYRAVTDFEKRHEAASPSQTRETAPASAQDETQTADAADGTEAAQVTESAENATWTDLNGRKTEMDGFASPSKSNVVKGAVVAIKNDRNTMLYEGEVISVGPKNVKILSRGGMGGDAELTFPRKDIVGVKRQSAEVAPQATISQDSGKGTVEAKSEPAAQRPVVEPVPSAPSLEFRKRGMAAMRVLGAENGGKSVSELDRMLKGLGTSPSGPAKRKADALRDLIEYKRATGTREVTSDDKARANAVLEARKENEAGVMWRRGDSNLDNLRRLMSGKGSAEERWLRALPELKRVGMYVGTMSEHMARTRAQAIAEGKETRFPSTKRKGADAGGGADVRWRRVTPAEDAAYMDAVERGDTETAERMVREAAAKNGYSLKAFHGTHAFGRTKFSNEWGGLFLTDRADTASNFANGATPRSISGTFRTDKATPKQIVDYVSKSIPFYGSARIATKSDFDKELERIAPLTPQEAKKYGISGNRLKQDADRYMALQDMRKRFDNGEIFFVSDMNAMGRSYGPNSYIATRGEVADLIDNHIATMGGAGVYALSLAPGKVVKVEGGGASYHSVPIPKALRKYARENELSRGVASTDQILRMASEAGFDTVEFDDIREGGDYGNAGRSTVYATTNPAQRVKSLDPVTRDDAGNVIPLSQRFNPDNADIRWRRSGIYTGTAADYANESRQGGVGDGPSLHHVGTGEGSQVYGWGLYGSTVRGVAEGYAKSAKRDKALTQDEDTFQAVKKVLGENVSDDILQAIYEGVTGNSDWNKVKAWIKRDAEWDDEIGPEMLSVFRKKEGALKKVHEQYAAHENLYEQTFFTDRAPGDESHLLKWYEPIDRRARTAFNKAAKELGVELVRRELPNGRKYETVVTRDGSESPIRMFDGGEYQGELYHMLADATSPKEASEALARAGIDGVKYPVDSYGGKGVKDGDEAGWNYVSFRDDNIQVDHKWRDGQLLWRRTYTPNHAARTAADNGTMTQREQDEVNSIMPVDAEGRRRRTSRDRQERAAREQASRDAFARAFHNAGTWQRVGMLLDKGTRKDAWRAVKESAIRKMQDAGLDLRKYEVRRFERQFGKPMSRWTNAEKEQFVSQSTYYAMDRAYGRKENLSLKLNQNYVRPLEKQIAENGLDEAWTDERGEQNIGADGKPLSKLDVYLMALHGGEYNRMIAERTARAEGGPILDGSGRSTEYWERQLARFRNEGFDRKAAEAVRLVHEMNKAALQQMVDSGRISQKQADKWNELSPNYVPLRNSDAAHDLFEQLLFGGDIDEQTYRKAFSGTEYNHAAGRRSLADSPVINSIQQAEWAIARSMDNESRRSLAAQVRADPRMGTVVMQMSKTDFDEAQRQIAVFAQMEANGTITPAQRDRLARLKQNVADTIAGNRLLPRRRMLNQNSEVQSVIDVQGLEDDPNVGWVAFKENGDTKYIKLGHHELVDANGNATGNMDELTGNRIAKFVNGQSFVKLGGVMRFVRNLSRGFGMLRTSLSPTFLFSNFLADNGQALRNVFHTLGPGAMRTFEGHAMDMGKNGARASALRYLRGQLDPNRYAIDRFTKEWAEAGGQIGGFATESFGDIDERMAASLRRMQRRLSRGKGGWTDALKDGARALGERFQELNSAIEMATRISAYATMRENGMGVNDAVSYARDVTVNFNRKGEWTPIFNALYVFSNANIQDMQRTGMTFTGSRAAKLNGTLFVLGLLSAALGFGQDEPDDEAEGKETWENASEHRKQNGISFRVGGKVISLPLRGLARMPYYAGHKAFEALTGRRDAKDVAADIGSFMFSAAAEPLSTTSSLAQSVAPSILRPAVELIENKSFTGAPIHRTKMSETQVASEMGRQSTSGMAVWLARTLNSLTGGNRNRSGLVDVFPETLEQIGRGLAGTLGTDLMKGVTLAKDIATFQTPATRDVPFVSRVASDMEKNSRRYHEAVTDFERDQKEYKDLAQEDPSVMAALRRNSPWFREGNEMWYNELDSLRKLNKKLMVEETKADGNERETLNELRMKTQGLFLWRLKHAPESDAPAKRAEYGQRNRLIDRMLRGRAAARKQEERNGRK